MKTFVNIYKAILLWVTAFSVTIFILGLESMMDENRWSLILVWLLMNILFYWMCKSMLTYRDVYKLSGTQWFERWLRPHNQ